MHLKKDNQPAKNRFRNKISIEPPESFDINDIEEPKQLGLNLGRIWRIIRRNYLLIASSSVGALSIAFFLASRATRTYEGNFRLLVEPITYEAKASEPSSISRNSGIPLTDTIDYSSLIEILKSPSLSSEIVKQIQSQYPDVDIQSLANNLVIERLGTDIYSATKIIEVRYMGVDPQKVQFVLEELAKGYLNYSLKERKTNIGIGVEFIESQLPRLQKELGHLKGKLQALQQSSKLNNPVIDGEAILKQARTIEEQKLETEKQLLEKKTLYRDLEQQLGLTLNEAIAASTLSEEPRYQELFTQLKKVESQIAIESIQFTEDNPVTQSLKAQQKKLSLLLEQEAQKILSQEQLALSKNPRTQSFQSSIRLDLINQLVNTANEIQVLEVRNQAEIKNKALFNQQLQQLPSITRQYNDIQQQLEIANKTLNQLLVQRDTLQIEAAQREVPWQIISAPSIPRDARGQPISNSVNSKKILSIALIFGFLLGLGLALLKEKYRNVFYCVEDIKDATGLPILGAIPINNINKIHSNTSATVGLIAGKISGYTEAFQSEEAFSSLYTSLRFRGSLDDPNLQVQSLVVSSAALGDGKTMVAYKLAQAAAAMGQRVLLVDANLRLPQIHLKIGLPNRYGLANLLDEELNPNKLIQQSPQEKNLFILTAGHLKPSSARLLASPQMRHFVKQIQAAFDLVIYDTADLSSYPETHFLAEHTDGILIVVRIGKTQHSLASQVLNRLDTLHLPVLGIVVNCQS